MESGQAKHAKGDPPYFFQSTSPCPSPSLHCYSVLRTYLALLCFALLCFAFPLLVDWSVSLINKLLFHCLPPSFPPPISCHLDSSTTGCDSTG
ncbi:hypothetical protein LX36DRAFT_60599 [Colletotrichum falcatum]|nr:hypothetical protein LX36DRAFT_60599 [Colletotrichum falcatum]